MNGSIESDRSEPGRDESGRDEPDARIATLIDTYFERRRAGEPLTPESFAAEHPDFANELKPYLDGLTLLERVETTLGIPSTETSSSVSDGTLPDVDGYELQEEIGRGGMGVVYRALQLGTKRQVALKVILGGPFASTAAERRFEREVELAARLDHPGIVRVLESGTTRGQKYYAMDYIRGERLEKHVATSKPNAHDTIELFARIAEIVEHAHDRDIVHRDLKPANVLIDDDAEPHVLDFGLAKALEQDQTQLLTLSLSTPGQVMGTLPYLSPEQAAGGDDVVGKASDVYALGVMLFEALTGRLPLDTRGSAATVLERIVSEPPPAPTKIVDHLDKDAEAIVLKALEKKVGQRYACAGELAADLGRYSRGEPVLARRRTALYVARKRLYLHRRFVAAALCCMLVLVVAAAYLAQEKRASVFAARSQSLANLQLMENGESANALARAQALFSRDPSIPDVRLVLARIQFTVPELYNRALRTLTDGLKDESGGWAYRVLLHDLYASVGESDRAEAIRSGSPPKSPATADDAYLLCIATLNDDRAIEHAERALDHDPRHLLALTRLARLYLRTGRYANATSVADRLIECSPDRWSWTLFKAHLLGRQGRDDEALAAYTSVLGHAGALPETGVARNAYLFRAHTLRRLGRYAEAIADYTAVAEIDRGGPGLLWDYYQRATCLWIVGRPAEAAWDLREFRALHGRPFFADARLYLVLLEQGLPDEASRVLSTARKANTDPWLEGVFACLAQELEPAALLARAGENLEKRCEACYYAGETCLLAENRTGAIKWFRRCIDTGVQFDVDSFPLSPMNEYELARWRLKTLVATNDPSGS